MIGTGLLSIGLFLLAGLEAFTPLVFAASALAVAGIGTGIFISPNTSKLMGTAP